MENAYALAPMRKLLEDACWLAERLPRDLYDFEGWGVWVKAAERILAADLARTEEN